MRRLLLLLPLLLLPHSARATFSLLHANAANTSCSGGSLTCAVTVTSTTAGNLLVGCAWVPATNVNRALSAGTGGTWVFPSNAAALQGSGTGAVSCGYSLSATGGSTSITLTIANSASGTWAAQVYEYHYTLGPLTAETVPAGTTSASCSNTCSTASVTVTGSNDLLISAIGTANTGCSVASPWADFASPSGDGYADHLNTTSGTGATYTQGTSCPTAAAGAAAMVIIGFKEASATSPTMPAAIY